MRIEQLKKEFDIKIKWRCFPLHPEIPEQGISIANLFTTTPEAISSYRDRLMTVAADLGLMLGNWDMIYNTRLAQELGLWAEFQNAGHQFHMAAFKTYLSDGKNISSNQVLLDIVESVGLPRSDAEAIIDERTFRDAVDKDWADARDLGITSVPTVIVNGNRLVGFQDYEKIAQLVRGDVI